MVGRRRPAGTLASKPGPPGRIPVYHEPALRPRIVLRSNLRHEIRIVDRWEEFTSHRETALCEVLIVSDLGAWDLWEAFVAHRAKHHLTPCVVVTSPSVENIRQTISVILHELVWFDRGRDIDLTEAISRACSEGLLHQCGQLFARATNLDPWLRDVLVDSVLASPAIREVNHVAALVRRDRRAVWDAWTDFVGPRPAVRLKAVLDLVLLLRAAHLRHLGLRWPRIARSLGVGLGVLGRRSEDRISKKVGELKGRDAPAILRLLASLLDGAPVEWPVKLEDFAEDVVDVDVAGEEIA
jgi:hypothetical protein